MWHVGESGDAYRVLVGKPEGKRPLGRLRHRWEDNIQEVEWTEWTALICFKIGTGGGLLCMR